MQPNPISPVPARNDFAETTKDRKEETRNPAAVPAGSANAAAGKTYVLFEGTILETVLINRLDGGFAGPVECLLSTDVYSNDRQHLLIPSGSINLRDSTRSVTPGCGIRSIITIFASSEYPWRLALSEPLPKPAQPG